MTLLCTCGALFEAEFDEHGDVAIRCPDWPACEPRKAIPRVAQAGAA